MNKESYDENMCDYLFSIRFSICSGSWMCRRIERDKDQMPKMWRLLYNQAGCRRV
jgi:hypothetical protein